MHTYIELLNIQIPFYGLCMAIAVMLCGTLVTKKAKIKGMRIEDAIIIEAGVVGGFILGGSFLYIAVTFSPAQIINYLIHFDFSFLRNTGLVFYGGLFGGIVGGFVSAKLIKADVDVFKKSAVPYIPLGHSIGRIGCLMAGCCYGFEYEGPFAVKNYLLSYDKTYFPVQLLESILDVIIMSVLLSYAKKENTKHDILYLYLCMYSVVRFFTEYLRGDEIRGHFLIFSSSQWISIFIIAFCIIYKKERCKTK